MFTIPKSIYDKMLVKPEGFCNCSYSSFTFLYCKISCLHSAIVAICGLEEDYQLHTKINVVFF